MTVTVRGVNIPLGVFTQALSRLFKHYGREIGRRYRCGSGCGCGVVETCCVDLDMRECTLQPDEGGAIDVCICKAQNDRKKKEWRKIVKCVTRWFVGRRDEGKVREEVETLNWYCWVVVARRTCSPTWCVRA